MTPKEKAENLVNKHLNINLSQVNDLVDGIRIRLAQENALITVNEMIEYSTNKCCEFQNLKYWEEVKQELEKL